jgi:hypothetical protein
MLQVKALRLPYELFCLRMACIRQRSKGSDMLGRKHQLVRVALMDLFLVECMSVTN